MAGVLGTALMIAAEGNHPAIAKALLAHGADAALADKAGKRAAEMAKHGTREEKSGKFLPPPGWKGRLVTADDAPAAPRKKRA